MSYNPENTSIRINTGRDGPYKSSEVGNRHKSDPKTGKDFKKVLEKGNDEEENGNQATKEIIDEGESNLIAAIDHYNKKKSPMSLFDLTSGKTTTARVPQLNENPAIVNKTTTTTDPLAVQHPAESPAKLYSKLTDQETKKVAKENIFDAADTVIDHPSEKSKFTTRFSTEQPDLSYVNPLAANNTQLSVDLNIAKEKIIPVTHIQEIINQMVEKVSEMKNTGQTDTVITLKHPPLFAGATIVVTAFDSAKNEFNISIENLTQAAKQLIDLQGNKESLLLALEQKGYAVHIFSATTLVESRPVDSLPQEEQHAQQQQRGNPEERRQRREEGQA